MKIILTIILTFTVFVSNAQVKEKQSPHFNKDSTKFWWCVKCDTMVARYGYKIKVVSDVVAVEYRVTDCYDKIKELEEDVKHYYHYYELYINLRDSVNKTKKP